MTWTNPRYAEADNKNVLVDTSDGSACPTVEQFRASYPDAPIADYVPPAPTWAGIRGERDALLKSTDWWGVSDRTMSAEETAYRQSLRDLPQTFANPEDVVWPTNP